MIPKATASVIPAEVLITKKALRIEPPVEMLFDLSVASVLIPMSKNALVKFLHRNPGIALRRYRLDGEHRRIRLLTGQEIVKIRARVIKQVGCL